MYCYSRPKAPLAYTLVQKKLLGSNTHVGNCYCRYYQHDGPRYAFSLTEKRNLLVWTHKHPYLSHSLGRSLQSGQAYKTKTDSVPTRSGRFIPRRAACPKASNLSADRCQPNAAPRSFYEMKNVTYLQLQLPRLRNRNKLSCYYEAPGLRTIPRENPVASTLVLVRRGSDSYKSTDLSSIFSSVSTCLPQKPLPNSHPLNLPLSSVDKSSVALSARLLHLPQP